MKLNANFSLNCPISWDYCITPALCFALEQSPLARCNQLDLQQYLLIPDEFTFSRFSFDRGSKRCCQLPMLVFINVITWYYNYYNLSNSQTLYWNQKADKFINSTLRMSKNSDPSSLFSLLSCAIPSSLSITTPGCPQSQPSRYLMNTWHYEYTHVLHWHLSNRLDSDLNLRSAVARPKALHG